jgi:hypothetical protein
MNDDIRYEIITNPVAGRMSVAEKLLVLRRVAGILNAGIHGLDSDSVAAFSQCSRSSLLSSPSA